MKKNIFSLFIIFCTFYISIFDTSSLSAKPKLINKQKALKAYGFTRGIFNKNNRIMKSIKKKIVKKIGKTEFTSKIDTAEEFLMAAFYSEIEIKNNRNKKLLIREMSTHQEGGLKLGAMWLRKRIDTSNYYDSAIKYICKHSNVKKSEIMSYYREAMSGEIDRIVRIVLGRTPRSHYTIEFKPGTKTVNAIDLIKTYYFAPTRYNYNRLMKACKYFGMKGSYSYKHRVCFNAMIKIIGHLSQGLKSKIIRDITKKLK